MWIASARTLPALRKLLPRWADDLEREVDSIYLGGGTPTVLDAAQLQRIFAAVRAHFEVASECRNHSRVRARNADARPCWMDC